MATEFGTWNSERVFACMEHCFFALGHMQACGTVILLSVCGCGGDPQAE